MLKRQFSLVLIAIMLAALVLPASAQAPTPAGPGITVPVSGTARPGGRVTGTFTILRFVEHQGGIGAAGKLVMTTATGNTIVTQAVMPVKAAGAAGGATGQQPSIQQLVCEILDLTLGPLDLNLLGLEVHLDTVHLLITANPAGGLLGQLLCGIANLLNLGVLGDILDALNDLLDALNNL